MGLHWGTGFSAVLLLLAGWQMWRVWQQPIRLLAPEVIVTWGATALYVVAYWVLPQRTRTYLVPEQQYGILVALATLCTTAFLVGCRLRHPRRENTRVIVLGTGLMYWMGFIYAGIALSSWSLFLVRSGGLFALYGSVHGAGGAWADSSAYLYELRMLIYPGLLLLTIGAARSKSLAIRVVVGGLWLAVLCNAWWLGSRGGWIRVGLVAGSTAVVLGWLRSARRARVGAIVAAVGVLAVVVLMPYVRSATTLSGGSSLTRTAERVVRKRGLGVLAGSGDWTGNELAVATGLVSAMIERHEFEAGEKWVYPVVGFVPRSVWSRKPYWNDFGGSYTEAIAASEGWTPAAGAAVTGVADSFAQFSFFCFLAWFAIGHLCGEAWRRAVLRRTTLQVGYLCAIDIGLVFFVMQDFKAAFYACFYFAGPLVLIQALVMLRNRPNRHEGITTAVLSED